MKVKKWLIPAVVLVLIAVVVAVISIVHGNKSKQEETVSKDAEALAESVEIDATANYISVESVESISGFFVEDGSDELIGSVLALDLKNNSDKTLRYAKLTLTVGKKAYDFEISTIPPGETVRAMEMNRSEMPDSMEKAKLSCDEGISWFMEEPDMCEKLLKLDAKAGTVELTNISGKTLNMPIYIYYKNYIDGVYVGGITYRAGTQEKIKAGKSLVINASHFDPEASKLIFVTYGS